MSEEREELLERYAAGVELIRESSEIVPFADWDKSPGAGEWSARQVLIHLADSEIVGAGRLRQLLAEERPTLYAYQQAAWAEQLGYAANQDVAEALELAAALRRSNVDLLRRVLTEATWARTAEHPTRGPLDLAGLLRLYISHLEGHLEQLRAIRAAVSG